MARAIQIIFQVSKKGACSTESQGFKLKKEKIILKALLTTFVARCIF